VFAVSVMRAVSFVWPCICSWTWTVLGCRGSSFAYYYAWRHVEHHALDIHGGGFGSRRWFYTFSVMSACNGVCFDRNEVMIFSHSSTYKEGEIVY